MIRTCAAGLRLTIASNSRTVNVCGNTAHIWIGGTTARVVRRWNASRPPIAQKAPESTKTIPGPSWLWLEPVYGPFRAYGRVQRRRPYMTQFLSALVIYFVGDFVAQSLGPAPGAGQGAEAEAEETEERGWVQAWAEERDWARTARALTIGGLAAVPGYKWFLWLGSSFNYSSKVLSLTTKVTINQLLFTPIFNSYFFGMQSFLSGATLAEITERVKNTVPVSWINSCKIWPAVTAFMFAFIPIEYRSIFGGVIAIGWQAYLSLLNQRAAAVEELEHANEAAAEEVKQAPARVREMESEGVREKCAA
ncbi:hypothetical protein K458DRAFT_364672 [Lentithecium fluviatile CBS 122367]|uniref:Uncharacterized protein n=1 Tax=Lentithecium fluviatile CBS 122367 TaxID=1168545 RepID=A0A6G1J5B4_9PLEO|nr:hypothetical protein K458DRAFT_364672 [Lentithecium fluviatile CBS 122367]